jgi:hypothetical protein
LNYNEVLSGAKVKSKSILRRADDDWAVSDRAAEEKQEGNNGIVRNCGERVNYLCEIKLAGSCSHKRVS